MKCEYRNFTYSKVIKERSYDKICENAKDKILYFLSCKRIVQPKIYTLLIRRICQTFCQKLGENADERVISCYSLSKACNWFIFLQLSVNIEILHIRKLLKKQVMINCENAKAKILYFLSCNRIVQLKIYTLLLHRISPAFCQKLGKNADEREISSNLLNKACK